MNTKTAFHLLCFWGFVLLSGCSNSSEDALLHHIERICQDGNTRPIPALNELASIEPEIRESHSHYVYNKYLLLLTRLRDKAYITATSSDTIENVVRYFEKYGNSNEIIESYYYQGSVYRDLKDYPRAVTSFNEALDIALRGNPEECPLLQNVYSQLFWLYKKQQLYGESLKMAKAGYEMAVRTKTVDPIYIMDVASSALYTGDTVESREYSLKALDWIRNNQSRHYPDIVCELLMKFSGWEMEKEAEECIGIIHSIPNISDTHNFFAAMAYYYESVLMMDSAMDYNRKILEKSRNVSQKMSAAHKLMDYYIQQGIYNLGLEYSEIYAQLVDSVFLENQYEQTSRACGNHLYAISMKKEMEAQEKANEYKIRNYYIVVFLLLSMLLASIFYGQKKRKFTRILADKQKVVDSVPNIIKQYDLTLEETEKEKREKEKIIKQLNDEIVSLNEIIDHHQTNILKKQSQIRELARLSLSNKVKTDSMVILQKLNEASQGRCKMENADWESLYVYVENMCPGFRESVTSMPRPSESIIKTAYLLKLGLRNAHIANITNCSRTTVWDRVRKIRECLGDLLENKS